MIPYSSFITVLLASAEVTCGGCVAGCISLLGMEGGAIVPSQISASSVHYGVLGLQRWGPELARLNNQGLVNAWTSATHDKNPWIEVRETSG